ncbi:MAG: fatty-acid--CoA ligase [Dehalococcoidia bacterium]|nr:MAG: fatty-acid--CoA ligase [Dehalococcoidia bacterium]
MPADLLALVQNNAVNQPGKTFLVVEQERLTFRDFAERVAGLAGGLRVHGIRSGDRVGIASYRGVGPIIAYYAAMWAGATPVLVSAALLSDLAGILRRTRCVALVYGDEAHPHVAPGIVPRLLIAAEGADDVGVPLETLLGAPLVEPVPHGPDDSASIVFSAGTTGPPKPVLRSHANLLWDAIQKVMIYRLGFHDVWLYITPRNLTALVGPTHPSLLTGSTYVVIEGFDPVRVAEVCAIERVTQLTLLAGQWTELLDLPQLRDFDLSSLRQVAAAASHVPEDVQRRLTEWFGDLPFLQVYGTSEAGMIAAMQAGDPAAAQPGAVGRPLPTVQVRIVGDDGRVLPAGEIGEVAVRGPGVALGYDGLPDATRRAFVDGYLLTGDLGRLDGTGVLALLGRRSDAFEVDGRLIYPSIVQEALFAVRGVREAAFVGVRDGSERRPVVFVAATRGNEVDVEAVRDAVHRAAPVIAAADVEVVLLPALPRTAAGKVDVRRLADEFRPR